MSWRPWLLRLAILVLVGFSPLASSSPSSPAVATPSIEDSFRRADVVARVRIDLHERLRLDGRICGDRYTAHVLESFKGPTRRERATFTFAGPQRLTLHDQYILFLEQTGSPASELHKRIERAKDNPDFKGAKIPEKEVPRLLRIVSCYGMVPGLQMTDLQEWHVARGTVDALYLWPRPPMSIEVTGSPSLWHMRETDVVFYLRSLSDRR